MKKIILTSAYCNPIHPGHIECFELAKDLGQELWVIINNDFQAELKRGTKSFQDELFRMKVVKALRAVDEVVLSIDRDASVVESIKHTVKLIKDKHGEEIEIIFAKGGDRFASEIPEAKVLRDLNIKIVDGLGAKIYNSSDFLNK
jgi:D-beta-D-heptose 7-phosphate kinase/D-beta-D-heptose 1-phosphate adenosyltransferase